MARDRGFEFLGVPYAIPPVGSNKAKHTGENVDYTWMPGTPPFRLEHCWKNVLKYPKSKPQECLQIRPLADGHFETYGSQDCLTLDIYSPYVGYDTPSPVVVVIAVPTLFGGWIDQAHQGKIFLLIPTKCPYYINEFQQIKLLRPPRWLERKVLCLWFHDSASGPWVFFLVCYSMIPPLLSRTALVSR
jgi:hypothetical protein